MKRALTAIVAAAGILGCARDVPVYSPQPEVVQEVPGEFALYKSVWSDAEQLKLSFYAEGVDGTRLADYSWSRFEPRDSAECLKEKLTAKLRVDFPEEGIAGWVDVSMADDACNLSVDSCNGTYTPDNGNQQNISTDVCGSSDETFASLKEAVNASFYNIDEQVGLWHNRKGL
ncbi:MAG: hypothetical protein QME12_00925 [Nanoarchaeota archaeon]|nr:hypothetical protein [Nanoarchaeota archaeon]